MSATTRAASLTEAVRRRPYQVVLFDEIEKAHPDVFNVLLQVLDDGRLTDGQGRTVDFRNTIIIMTSNLGAEYLVALKRRRMVELVRGKVLDAVIGGLPARNSSTAFDDIIALPPARPGAYGRRSSRSSSAASRGLLKERDIGLHLTEKAREWLADAGYDPAYGARPLKRVIQREVQDRLAEEILAGRVVDGGSVRLDAGDAGLILVPLAPEDRRKPPDLSYPCFRASW